MGTEKRDYQILDTVKTSDLRADALKFSACLGADRGYSSELVDVDEKIIDVVASDNRAIRFVLKAGA